MTEDEEQKEKMIKRTHTFPPSTLARLQRLAKQESRNVSAQLVLLLNEALDKAEKSKSKGKRDESGQPYPTVPASSLV